MLAAWDDSGIKEGLDDEGRLRVRAEQIDPLFQFPSRLLGHIFNAALVSAVLWGEISNVIISIWLGASMIVIFARVGLSVAYQRGKPAPADIGRWETMFLIGSIGSAILWGASSFIVWLHPDLSYHAFVALALGGTAAAVAMTTYPHLPTLHWYLFFAGTPLAVNLFLKGDGIYLAMGLMVSLFIVIAIGHAKNANQILIRSLVLREKARSLVADISTARDSLEVRVRERTAELDEANVTVRAEMAAHQETEGRLRQAQKMEAVGQLTGGVAHDFNNLLSEIQGNLELITNRNISEKELSPKIEAMMRASKRGAELTRQLLAFSRRETLRPQAVEVNDLIPSMIQMLKNTIGEAVEIRFVPEGGPCAAHVDPGQLESAILNLAINARDAMPDGGVLTIATASGEYQFPAEVSPDLDVEKKNVPIEGTFAVIAVSDTGAGISPENIDQVWKPFFTTKDVGEGNGLGLNMVYGFVKQSGGHLEIDSTENVGTTVKLYLPALASDQP